MGHLNSSFINARLDFCLPLIILLSLSASLSAYIITETFSPFHLTLTGCPSVCGSQLIEAMVSFQTPLSPDPTRPIVSEFENLSKKRKWEKTGTEEVFKLQSKAKSTKSIFDIELQLETPLPLEWQRCLDIQVHLRYIVFM